MARSENRKTGATAKQSAAKNAAEEVILPESAEEESPEIEDVAVEEDLDLTSPESVFSIIRDLEQQLDATFSLNEALEQDLTRMTVDRDDLEKRSEKQARQIRQMEEKMPELDTLRDPRLTPIQRGDIQTITLTQHEGVPPIRLSRESGNWQVETPEVPWGLEQQVVEQTLDQILGARATSFVELDGAPDTEPVRTIQFSALASSEDEVLNVYAHDGDRLMVVRGDERVGHVITMGLIPPVDSALAFRDRTVLNMDDDQLESLRVVRLGEFPADYSFRRIAPSDVADSEASGEPRDWALAGYDADAFHQLVDLLTPLRVTVPFGTGLGLFQ